MSRGIPVACLALALALTLGAGAAFASPDSSAAPPGIEAERLLPLAGAARDKAGTSAEDLLKALPAAPFSGGPDGQEPAAPNAEPGLEAQRAYMQAAQALNEGRAYEAVRKLLLAERRAPESADIARLLGEIYTRTGNKVRGATYLKKAATLDPSDLDTVFMLARFELDQQRWGTAAASFLHALELEKQHQAADDTEADPGREPLLHYYLGVALQRAGYASQAVEYFRAYLEHPRQFDRRTPRIVELAFVDHSIDQTWQSVGDLHNQLAQPKRALEAYAQAAERAPRPSVALAQRQVYTMLELRDADAAEALILDFLRAATDQGEALSLVDYYFSRADSEQLAQELERLYEQGDRTSALALAVADLLPPDRRQELLLRHITEKPNDQLVFAALIRSALVPEGTAKQRRTGQGRAAALAGRAMAAAPADAMVYADAVTDAVGGSTSLLEAIATLPTEQAQTVGVKTLEGIAHRRLRQYPQASEALTAALALDPGAAVARLELARVLVAQAKLDEAATMLQGDWPGGDLPVTTLRARILSQAQRPDEALRLLDAARAEHPRDAGLVLVRTQILLSHGRTDEAERTLRDALNADPTQEEFYAALIEYYRTGLRMGQRKHAEPLKDVMTRLLSTLPRSRTARLVVAELRMDAREFDRSEKILKELIVENADDLDAVQMLINLYERTNRPDEANRLRERFLRSLPEGADRAVALAILFRNTDRLDRAIDELTAALRSPHLDRPSSVVHYLWRYRLELDPAATAEAEAIIDDAIKRYPAHDADLRYEKATFLSRTGREDLSHEVMADILEDHPNHAPSANGLGYAYAVAGENLDEAKELIARALAQDPDSAAFLDSMGWVLYKQKDFDGAIKWLRQAYDADGGAYPVILDHLGDALYRRGRHAEAVKFWDDARTMLNRSFGEFDDDPEIEGLLERLEAKVREAKTGGDPPVAPLPGEPVEGP